MPDYEKMYYTLFNVTTETIECLKRGRILEAVVKLTLAQKKTEELYIDADDSD